MLYQFLLAEIAGARGQFDVAVPAYLDLARRTQDARIARRATEVAIYARQMPAATEAAQLWARLDPDSPDAKRILAGVMSRGGVSVDAIQAHLAKVLAESGDSLDRNLLGLNAALAQMQDKKAVRAIIERVTEPYLEHPEADFARAHAAFNAGDTLSAMTRIDQALALRSDWEPAVLMKAQLLQRDDPMHRWRCWMTTSSRIPMPARRCSPEHGCSPQPSAIPKRVRRSGSCSRPRPRTGRW